jgi:hypothetical protein
MAIQSATLAVVSGQPASGRADAQPAGFNHDASAEVGAGTPVTHRDVVPFLLRHKLLQPADVVCGQVDIIDVSRRNRNFSVVRDRGGGYVIKQGVGAEKSRLVRHEANVYRFISSHRELKTVRQYLPRFYLYDAEHCVLVVERVLDAHSLFEHHTKIGRFPRRLTRTFGEVVALLHRKMSPPEVGAAGLFVGRPPFGLSLHRPDLMILDHCSQAGIEFVRILQSDETACAHLDRLFSCWRPESLIHADLRWENCMVSMRPAKGIRRLAIVDWELARFGDPAWDVGTVFGEYLAFWLLSTPIGRDLPPEEFLTYARHPLGAIQPAIWAFWTGYRTNSNREPAASEAFMIRATEYSAVRLIQAAYERLQTANEVTAEAVLLLQLGVNILQRPQEAAVRLLGIPLV